MGARNVVTALGIHPGKVDNAPRITLIAMSVLSLDDARRRTSARTYYGGWERLAAVQGMVPNETSRRLIARHMRTLLDAGLITQLSPPAPGRNATWLVNLPVDNSPSTGDKPP